MKGVTLYKNRYSQSSEKWDHDHCEFYWSKFATEELIPEALHEGYTTEDEYRWICKECFQDFKEVFSWKVIDKTK